MSKEFNELKREVLSSNHDKEIQRRNSEIEKADKEELIRILALRQFEKDKQTLQAIKSLFEEIRDSGLVKCTYKPEIREIPIYKTSTFTGCSYISEYRKETVSDCKPAFITETNFEEIRTEDYYKIGRGLVRISLHFNERSYNAGEGEIGYNYDTICIAVVGNQLNLVQNESIIGWTTEDLLHPPYKPIEKGQLAKVIAQEISNKTHFQNQ